MDAAEISDVPVLLATIGPESVRRSNQLYYMLIMLSKGSALSRIVSAGTGEGLEAWRLMVQHHEPVSRTRAAGLLTELLQYDFTGDFSAKLIQFESVEIQF